MTSHRDIFRSSAIIGGASVINIVVSILKVKVLAVLLGPAGIGLLGLYQNIIGVASTLAGCGLGSSGVRQLAASADEEATLGIVRRALWRANLGLGVLGMLLLWLLREPVAKLVFGDDAHVGDVGWLGLGVLLTLIAGSQTALLQGLRRIADLARISIASAVGSAIVGIAMVNWLGQAGVVWFVLAVPAVTIPIAAWFTSGLPGVQPSTDWGAIVQQWRSMVTLGIPMMAAALLLLTTQLVARSIILRELGLDASGYFQAAVTVSMTYIGFVLGAMAADYFPRLTATIADRSRSRRLVNEQAEMALLLSGPVLLGMITFAPWVIQLLYASSFAPAVDVLRWQVLGDILKVASWPIGFILMAQGRGVLYICTELVWCIAYLAGISLGISEGGLVISGVAFWIAYLIYYLTLTFAAFQLIGYKHDIRNIALMSLLLLAGSGIILLAAYSTVAAYTLGVAATVLACTYSLRRLDGLVDVRGFLLRRFGKRTNE